MTYVRMFPAIQLCSIGEYAPSRAFRPREGDITQEVS